jgi:acetate kinase
MYIWTINAGSSSLKYAIFAGGDSASARGNCVLRDKANAAAGKEAQWLANIARQHDQWPPHAIAHRIVHGGADYAAPVRLTHVVRDKIARLSSLAPLHNPVALRWIDACTQVFGAAVPQIAVFDTAFFSVLPEAAWRYAIPRHFADRNHLRRFGFHGIAHEQMWREFSAQRPGLDRGGRLVTLQLGAGCSAAAILNGTPQDTSMGFSPLEGLVMATRAGDIDAGLLLHLQRELGYDVHTLEHLLTRESGLLGLSSQTRDDDSASASVSVLLRSTEPAHQLAIEIYCRRIAKYVGAFATVLGGLDGIVFGGGVGENVPEVRARVLRSLEFLGVRIDPKANEQVSGETRRISDKASAVDVCVVAVDEEAAIASAASNSHRDQFSTTSPGTR